MKKISLFLILLILILGCSYDFMDDAKAKKMEFKYKITYASYALTVDGKEPYYKFIFYTNQYEIQNNAILLLIGHHLKTYPSGKFYKIERDEIQQIGNWTFAIDKDENGFPLKNAAVKKFYGTINICNLNNDICNNNLGG